MWNKQRSLSVVWVAGLLAAFAWLVLRPHEPVYQGKPLNFWFQEAYQNGELWNEYSKPKAEVAMRALGTNAIPLLVSMARTRFSGWRILWRMTFGASLAQMAHDPQFAFLQPRIHFRQLALPRYDPVPARFARVLDHLMKRRQAQRARAL